MENLTSNIINLESELSHYLNLATDDMIDELTTYINFYKIQLVKLQEVPDELICLILAVKTINRHKDDPDPEIDGWDIRSGYPHYLAFIEYLNKTYKN